MLLNISPSTVYSRALSLIFILLGAQCIEGIISAESTDNSAIYDILERRDTLIIPPPCGFWMIPENTTTCAEVLSTYQLTANDFLALNSLRHLVNTSATDCYGLVPHTKYCVAAKSPNLVSTDGSCGPKNNNAVCPGSPFGDCCSVNGWCGNGYAFCGIGNCIGGKCVNGTGWSTDGRCGTKPMEPKCGGQFGVCCSNAGWCGNGTDYCNSDNCAAGACLPISKAATSTRVQCVAGACWTSLPPTGPAEGTVTSTTSVVSTTKPPTSTTKSSTSSTKTTTTAAATPTSPDGSCGGTKGFTCAGTTFGGCCSSAGYCGKTGVFCGEGCQTKWSSSCQTTNISSNNGRCGVVAGSGTFTCVGGQFDGMCCSSGGYCGSTTAHCGTGCQKSYGRCT